MTFLRYAYSHPAGIVLCERPLAIKYQVLVLNFTILNMFSIRVQNVLKRF